MSDQINLEEIFSLMKDGTLSNFANSIKGFGNEMGVAMYLNMHFPEPKYILLCDLLFPQENNVGSVQIDMVIVSVYGIFVIEAKNYHGVIYGNENSYEWFKYNHGTRYEFMNPIHQNYGHIKCLKSIIQSDKEIPIYSAVIFSEDCRLKAEVKNSFVGYNHDLPDYLQSFSEPVLSEEEVRNISDQLKNANIASIDNFAQHQKESMERKEKFDKKISDRICPRCGGKLVERNGKYGKFYGCSNFPECRFTKNIE